MKHGGSIVPPAFHKAYMDELVYIVDDEAHIRTLLEIGLKDRGFYVRAFADGAALLAAVANKKPDVMVLDWMMPPPDGIELTKRLRQDSRTRAIPILLLTARALERDRVSGLELGADDYLTKPFSIKELAARLRALLRRDAYLRDDKENRHTCGALEVDERGRQAYLEGHEVLLTMREFDLLLALIRNQGRVLSREVLLDSVWGLEYFGDQRTVDVHIRYLRKKLAPFNNYIVTVRGVGYKLTSISEEQL